jgi:hypothetical protein
MKAFLEEAIASAGIIVFTLVLIYYIIINAI